MKTENLYRISKPKMSSQQLVEKMKNEKGIRFSLVTEQEAACFLNQCNNYLRTASYRHNYLKHTSGPQKGTYIKLEFAYLQELSQIDSILRHSKIVDFYCSV